MKKYEEYRDTSLEWLRLIPLHWDWLYLSQVCTEQKNKNRDNVESNVLSLSYGNVIRKKNINSGLTPTDYATYQVIERNNVILRLTDLQNDQRSLRTGHVSERGIITSAYVCLRPAVNSKYIHYALHSFDTKKVFYGMGSGVRQSMGFKEIKQLRIPIPSPLEQDQIVKYLDWKVSQINKYIKAKKRQIELLKELKQAEINRAVTKGLDPNAPMKESQNKWVGEVPSHWKENYLFQITKEHSISNKEIHNQNLLSLSYGKIVNKDINQTEGLLPASYDTYQIVEDMNIVLRLTDLQNDQKSLRVGLSTQEGIITSAYTALECVGNVIPEYLYYLLHSYDVSKVFYGMGGGLRQSMGYKEIKKLIVYSFSKEEQQQIVEYCKCLVTQKDKAVERLTETICYLEELKSSLISDVVTGKADVRGVEVPEGWVEEEESVAEEADDLGGDEIVEE